MCSTDASDTSRLTGPTGADPRALSDMELAERVVGLRQEIDAQEAEWLALLHEFDQRRAFEADGSVSTQSWLRHNCNLAPGDASGRTRTARRLADLPAVAAAFGAGKISYAHVRQIVLLADQTDLETTQRCADALVTAARHGPARLRA